MNLHVFKYALKTLFRNKMLIFWTFAFPIVLGLFFSLAFSDIEKNEQLKIIDIAIIDNEYFNSNSMLKENFEQLGSKDSTSQLFNIKYTDITDAKSLLENKEISGIILYEEGKQQLLINENGISTTIIKYVMDEINQVSNVVQDVLESSLVNGEVSDVSSIVQNVIKKLESSDQYINDISSDNLSYTMIEYYTLLAMTCLYGGILSGYVLNQTLANMSSKGKRVSICPVNRGKVIISSLLASYLCQIIGCTLLFLFLYFILKVDFGQHLFRVILLTVIGSFAGMSMGITISSIFKCHENTKTSILIAVTMLGCFLSGMMGITMKYIVDKYVPLLNKLNPASMITDGFYSLYYYDTFNRYYFDILSILAFSLILLFISYFVLRRQKYDNI